MAAAEQYVPDSDDEMGQDSSGDEMDEISITLTPQEWKAKAGDLYKVSVCLPQRVSSVVSFWFPRTPPGIRRLAMCLPSSSHLRNTTTATPVLHCCCTPSCPPKARTTHAATI